MHEDLIERRLRAALRGEADRQPFTITAAELERRAARRGGSVGNRRMSLLLAAAVAIGALGGTALIGGLLNDRVDLTPGPTDAPIETPRPSAAAPAILPALEELIATAGLARVAIAQAHDPLDPSHAAQAEHDSHVYLGSVTGEPHEVHVACESTGEIVLNIKLVPGSGPPTGPSIPCDRAVHVVQMPSRDEQAVAFSAPPGAAWRLVVVRSTPRDPTGTPDAPAATFDPDLLSLDELIRLEDQVAEVEGGSNAQRLQRTELGGVPARRRYWFELWCVGGDRIQYIHGDEIDGAFHASTITQVPCDGRLHRGELEFTEISGGPVYVAANPGSRWSILLTAEKPPVALVRELAGWQLSAGVGPDLAFETATQTFTGPGVEGGGPVMIAVACAGTGTMAVTVRLQRATEGQVTEDTYAQFDAWCLPDGATTTQSFAAADAYVDVEYTTTAGNWAAVSILVPNPLPSPP